jgi:hypothetical protein
MHALTTGYQDSAKLQEAQSQPIYMFIDESTGQVITAEYACSDTEHMCNTAGRYIINCLL